MGVNGSLTGVSTRGGRLPPLRLIASGTGRIPPSIDIDVSGPTR